MQSTIKKIISLGFICFFITSCGGGGGSEAAIAPKPSVNLSADPTSVLLENTSTLTWSSLNTTSCSATWTSKTSTSGSELVTIATPGNNAFSISCSGDGGTGQSSVTVEGYRNTSGVVVDGYISGAEVCIDEDDSWTCDADENSTISDNNGNYTIKYAGGNLVSIGGMDLDSQTFLDNLLITHKLTDYSDFKAITPVTSVAAFMEDSSLVNAALGIDPSIDVFTFDPVANKGDGGINDYLYEKGNQLTVLAFAFQNIINNLNATTETTQDYFQAITEEIEKEYTETNAKVDIETESFISQALDNVIAAKSASIDENTKANTAKALASVLPVIQVKSSDYLTTSVIRFAVSTLQTDIQGIANGTASEEIIKSYTEDVLTHIAEDQNISANEITPSIFAIADAASTQEDTAITVDVLLNDSYLNSAPISLTVSDGFNGTTAVTESFPKQISYSPDPDFNGTDTFSYTITQGDKIASADVTVTIEAVNDAPSINIASFRAAENQTAIGTVAATDAEGDAVTFTVSGSELAITSAGVLTFASVPDYETKTSYTATVTASDGTNSSTQDITVSVTNVNDVAPGFTSSASFSAAENQTAIGTVAATDAEGDAVTFTVSGSELAITSAGVLTFASAPDYETKTSYTATVTASDGTNSSTQDITVSVTNVNDVAPGFTSSASFSAAENQTAIGTVAATDTEGDAVTFTVSGSELAITSAGVLTFASVPDYETKTSYTATVTASDGTNSSTQDITVSVTNVNDVAPGFTSSASFGAAENQTAIGTVAATDAEGDAVTFTVSGTELAITSAGVLTFASAPDYETKTSYTATVTASDGTNSSTQDITVSVTNVNEAPIFTSSASFSAAENQTAIGSVSVVDSENATLTYSLSGTDASSLAISSSGVITFGSAPNYESKNSYSATVAASDGTNITTQAITVSVTNVNDAPVATAASYFMNLKPQSQTSGRIALAGTDEDGDTLTYSIVSNGVHGTASLSGTTVTYQTDASTQSAQSESFTFKVNDGTVDSSAATISIDLRTDPLYKYQWHLNNTGQTNFATNAGTSGADLNVDSVIASNVYGTGVNIGIIDGGIELDHEDLSSNVLANASWDYVDADRNPAPVGNDRHGTAIAGITSATGWNNLGGRGIAPGSKFASYNMLDSSSPIADLIDAVGAGDGSKADNSNIDIYNMSFGLNYPIAYESVLSGDLLAAFNNGINNLRSGKGAIYIKSAGNYYRYIESESYVYCGPNSQLSDLMPCHDSSHNKYGANPHFITVSAITAKDGRSTYASAGSNIWVSAYGGEFGTTHPAIMTTDLATCSKGSVRTGNASSNAFNNQGNHSENTSCNYTAQMNGSSSAAPMVAGVVALMLEKEPNLTWRDVKHILATTADVIDSDQQVTHRSVIQHDWRTNAAGHEFHNWYGFGKVNAQAAVNAADSYTIGSLGTLCTISGTTGVINQALSDNTNTSVINIPSSSPCDSGVIEFVKVKMYYSHAAPNTVGMRLQSPSNTIANIITPYSKITTNPNEAEFNIGVSSFYGESMTGNWTIAIDDYEAGTTGNLRGWTIEIYGH